MLWTSCGLIGFLPYYIKNKERNKEKLPKGSLKKTSVMFCQRSGRFFKLCFFANYAGSSRFQHSLDPFVPLISRNKFFACLQILHHIQNTGLKRMLYLCNPFTQCKKIYVY